MTQHKAFGILAASAVLAAGLLGTAKPTAASGFISSMSFGQRPVAAEHNGWNDDGDRDHQREERRREEFRQEQFRQAEFRRQQELRRIEERREERQRSHRPDHDGARRLDRPDNYQNDGNHDFYRHDDNR